MFCIGIPVGIWTAFNKTKNTYIGKYRKKSKIEYRFKNKNKPPNVKETDQVKILINLY